MRTSATSPVFAIPFKISRTLTICNGIYSRGVFGAVRCLTDASVREENEKYLAERFPNDEFAMLLRVPVVSQRDLVARPSEPRARASTSGHRTQDARSVSATSIASIGR